MRVDSVKLGYKSICTPRVAIKSTNPSDFGHPNSFESTKVSNPSFKSKVKWGGALGCLGGAVIGFLVGGPIGMVIGGASGAIGGDVAHAKLDKNYPYDDYGSDDDYYTSYSSHYD